jgi:hypothetical protein
MPDTPSDTELLDELDLGGAPRPRSDTLERPHINGRVAEPLHCEYSRDLGTADIEALKLPRGSAPPRSLVRIHASHHSLARCLAAGMKPAQAALVTGYSPGRINDLQKDPAFQALVADYSAEARSIFADLAERMANISLDAIELLQERLHDDPKGFTVPLLLDIVKAFADRTGHGPGQEVHIKMDRDFIDRPPRETFEEWAERRSRELGERVPEMKKLN